MDFYFRSPKLKKDEIGTPNAGRFAIVLPYAISTGFEGRNLTQRFEITVIKAEICGSWYNVKDGIFWYGDRLIEMKILDGKYASIGEIITGINDQLGGKVALEMNTLHETIALRVPRNMDSVIKFSKELQRFFPLEMAEINNKNPQKISFRAPLVERLYLEAPNFVTNAFVNNQKRPVLCCFPQSSLWVDDKARHLIHEPKIANFVPVQVGITVSKLWFEIKFENGDLVPFTSRDIMMHLKIKEVK